jgi:hypothetical protein
MKRIALTVAALGAALSPAALGLWGNASFSQAVPVDVPPSAEVVTIPAGPSTSSAPRPAPRTSPPATAPASTAVKARDDHGGEVPRDGRTEAGDDRGSQRRSAPAAPRARTHTPAPARTTEAGDDHGGDVPRDQRTEAGDDRDGSSATDDDSSDGPRDSDGSGSHEGSDDRGSGGHGSDDAGSDDHGRHGSDD